MMKDTCIVIFLFIPRTKADKERKKEELVKKDLAKNVPLTSKEREAIREEGLNKHLFKRDKNATSVPLQGILTEGQGSVWLTSLY